MIVDLNAHNGEILCIKASIEGDKLITGSADSLAKVWVVSE